MFLVDVAEKQNKNKHENTHRTNKQTKKTLQNKINLALKMIRVKKMQLNYFEVTGVHQPDEF